MFWDEKNPQESNNQAESESISWFAIVYCWLRSFAVTAKGIAGIRLNAQQTKELQTKTNILEACIVNERYSFVHLDKTIYREKTTTFYGDCEFTKTRMCWIFWDKTLQQSNNQGENKSISCQILRFFATVYFLYNYLRVAEGQQALPFLGLVPPR